MAKNLIAPFPCIVWVCLKYKSCQRENLKDANLIIFSLIGYKRKIIGVFFICLMVFPEGFNPNSGVDWRKECVPLKGGVDLCNVQSSCYFHRLPVYFPTAEDKYVLFLMAYLHGFIQQAKQDRKSTRHNSSH